MSPRVLVLRWLVALLVLAGLAGLLVAAWYWPPVAVAVSVVAVVVVAVSETRRGQL